MSDLRKDPISGRWVIVAKNRAQRPDEFEQLPMRRVAIKCPFCAGNEADTPPSIATYPKTTAKKKSNAWQVRVIPNKYPALVLNGQVPSLADPRCVTEIDLDDDEPTPRGDRAIGQAAAHSANSIYESMTGVGVHELFIESPDHVSSFTDLSDRQTELTFLAYRDRLLAARENEWLACGLVFKNAGAGAGASLDHVHSHLVATPIVPSDLQQELANSLEFFRQRQVCIFCTMLEQEIASGERLVAQSPNFVAFCPFASRFPCETWIFPRHHASSYEHEPDSRLLELSHFVRDIVRRLEQVLARPAYNYVIHSAPFAPAPCDHYHWHLEIFPRVTRTAGLEWGAGCFINATPPEEAATRLRDFHPRESQHLFTAH